METVLLKLAVLKEELINIKTNLQPKEIKKPLVTNEETDRFLFETVFNVDFSRIK